MEDTGDVKTSLFLREISEERLSEMISTMVVEKIESLLTKLKPDEFITRQQAAEILKISLPTLRKWTTSGKLKSYQINRTIRYRLSDINTALTRERV